MTEHYYAVIMAGGGGTRLWPLSRKDHPKQVLRLFDDRTLFQIAVDRLEGLFPPERIFVVTVAAQAQALQSTCPQIPQENFLREPCPRGTASVVGLAAAVLQVLDPQAVMAVLTADHFIAGEQRFRQLLEVAYQVALDDHLVTLGIQPTYPATGFGYIQRGELLSQFSGVTVYRVHRFVEKPPQAEAQKMVAAGDHYWNSGMFIWKVGGILDEIQRQMPSLAASLEKISHAWGSAHQAKVLDSLWPQLEPQTIDYGVMEGAQDVAVVPGVDLGWSDVGSWESLFEVLHTDEVGNVFLCPKHHAQETRDSLVYANQKDRLVVTIGVQNLIIVDTDDVLLVCPRDQAQAIRQVVKVLQGKYPQYL